MTARGTGPWPMWVLGSAFMLDAIDQNVVRGIVPELEHAFHVGDFAIGVLMSAFVVVNGLVTLPGGYLADRWQRTKAVGATIAGWSVLSALGGAMPNFPALVAVRSALGFGQAVTDPSSSSLLGDYYQLERRGRAFSVQQSLSFAGFGLGIALGGLVGTHLGWRYAFVLVSSPGLLVALLAARLPEPRRGHADRARLTGVDDLQADLAEGPRERVFAEGPMRFLSNLIHGLRDDVATILRIPTLRFALVGVSALLFTVTAVGSWMPEFYRRDLHMSQGTATAAFGALVVAAGIPGVLVGGRLADRLATRVRGARVVVPGWCLVVTCTLFLASYLWLPAWAAYPLQLVGFFTATLAIPALRAGFTDAVPAQLRGAGFGAFALASVLFGSGLAPVATSFIATRLGDDFRNAFLVLTPVAYVGAALLLMARDHLERDTQALFAAVARAIAEQSGASAPRPRPEG